MRPVVPGTGIGVVRWTALGLALPGSLIFWLLEFGGQASGLGSPCCHLSKICGVAGCTALLGEGTAVGKKDFGVQHHLGV